MKEETTVNTGVKASGDATPGTPSGKAFGRDYFKCNSKSFDGCLQGRKKGKHWKKFIGDNAVAENIRTYLKKNPKTKSIMLRNGDAPHYIMANRSSF